jgi:hypothetical protein
VHEHFFALVSMLLVKCTLVRLDTRVSLNVHALRRDRTCTEREVS